MFTQVLLPLNNLLVHSGCINLHHHHNNNNSNNNNVIVLHMSPLQISKVLLCYCLIMIVSRTWTLRKTEIFCCRNPDNLYQYFFLKNMWFLCKNCKFECQIETAKSTRGIEEKYLENHIKIILSIFMNQRTYIILKFSIWLLYLICAFFFIKHVC